MAISVSESNAIVIGVSVCGSILLSVVMVIVLMACVYRVTRRREPRFQGNCSPSVIDRNVFERPATTSVRAVTVTDPPEQGVPGHDQGHMVHHYTAWQHLQDRGHPQPHGNIENVEAAAENGEVLSAPNQSFRGENAPDIIDTYSGETMSLVRTYTFPNSAQPGGMRRSKQHTYHARFLPRHKMTSTKINNQEEERKREREREGVRKGEGKEDGEGVRSEEMEGVMKGEDEEQEREREMGGEEGYEGEYSMEYCTLVGDITVNQQKTLAGDSISSNASSDYHSYIPNPNNPRTCFLTRNMEGMEESKMASTEPKKTGPPKLPPRERSRPSISSLPVSTEPVSSLPMSYLGVPSEQIAPLPSMASFSPQHSSGQDESTVTSSSSNRDSRYTSLTEATREPLHTYKTVPRQSDMDFAKST